jgi:hypothetical protein
MTPNAAVPVPFAETRETLATTSRLGPLMTPQTMNDVQVTCLVCAETHLISPKTGKVLGSDDE